MKTAKGLLATASVLFILLATACATGQAPPTAAPPPTEEPTVQATVTPRGEAVVARPTATPARREMPTPRETATPVRRPEATVAPPARPTPAPPRPTAARPTPVPTLPPVEGAPQVDEAAVLPGQDTLSTVEVVKRLRPSVVHIATEVVAMGIFNQPVPSRGVGTGIVLDTEGHILTNNHVIQGARRIVVTTPDGKSYPARVVGTDFSTDLAVLKIEAEGLTPAPLGDSDTLEVGEDVVAIGHALDLPGGPTVSKGVVSALGRSIETDAQNTIVDLIQTDASINPGNSGGPLVNLRGEVVGVNTAIIQGGRGIGFAININDAKEVARQLIARGFVERGFLGISPANVTPGLASRFGLAVGRGILIVRVIPGTAAAQAGLREGDVIVQMGGQEITNTGELSKFLMDHPPGETVEVVFFRGERRMTVEVTLGERPR